MRRIDDPEEYPGPLVAIAAGLAIIVDAQIERDEAVTRLQTALDLDERIADSDYLRDELYWSFSAISRLESILRRLDANQ